MNIQLDPAFMAETSRTTGAVERLKREDGKASFKDALADKIGETSNNGASADGGGRVRDEKLWDTCVEFESIFVGKLFDEMRKTVHKGDLINGGHAEEIFEDFLYDEYAKITSKKSNIGIASMLYRQLS